MLRWLVWLLLLPLSVPLLVVRSLLARFKPATALRIELSGELADVSTSGVLSPDSAALLPVLDALELATRDPKIKTVLVHLEDFRSGLGLAEELRAALCLVKAAGKRVILHADELGLPGLWVSLGASEVAVSPSGAVNVLGFGSEFTLLRGLFDKLGLNPQLVARGKYKSMREMFTEHEISPANREMILALLGELSSQLGRRIHEARGITPEQFEELLQSAPFRPKVAKQVGLVDSLVYFDELLKPLKDDSHERLVSSSTYLKVRRRRFLPIRAPRVALLTVSGNIKNGQNSGGPGGPRATGSTAFAKAVARAAEDRSIKAIVLRVNSPGGSALASDLMWRALRLAQEKKPVFVSMANVAASGGYYVSGLPGTRVWANPTTITGSIGVVGGKFSSQELLEKLGVKKTRVNLSPRAGFFSPSYAFSAEELAKLEEDIQSSYEEFVQKMADGRSKTYDQLHSVAQGRVWTGSQALEHGLVDELGGMTDVLAELRKSLGFKPTRALSLVHFGRQGLVQTLKARLLPGSMVGQLAAELPQLERGLGLADDFKDTNVFAMMPFEMKFR